MTGRATRAELSKCEAIKGSRRTPLETTRRDFHPNQGDATYYVNENDGVAGAPIGDRARTCKSEKIPNVLVIGEREAEDETVTLRRHGIREQQTLPVEEFRARLVNAIRTRSREL